ncbi:hypothetical protein D3Y57_01490 (plasmid) [Sphingomonas paeninsulae]|jgi:hypothetical protein|uniref:Uncharacterized protein n=1 Tax=Sphingomonas paeninsulae TaxID=2319844 RepID=A0A494TCG0_SPHPE|nr:hypothetical protein [Sphingomonas paeninsulae]AYJ84793.1 hypothetical protein D3Y57_01490 [Sphingomonas paeninsulae]
MHRLIAFFACLTIFLSLGMGSVAHTMEPITCIDAGTSAETGHTNGDQVPADSDNGYPHHHGGCHGHHVATAAAKTDPTQQEGVGLRGRPTNALALATSGADPALRPPRT